MLYLEVLLGDYKMNNCAQLLMLHFMVFLLLSRSQGNSLLLTHRQIIKVEIWFVSC